MAESDTKLRRAAGGGPGFPQYAPVPAAKALDYSAKMGDDGIKGHSGRCLQRRARLFRFLQRKGLDIFVMTQYFTFILVGHAVALFWLCDPTEALLVKILRPLFILTSFLFNLSWIGVVYHGPGSVFQANSEEAMAAFRLPVPLAAALEVGRLGSKEAFSADVITCSKCDRQKTPLEHHCSTCNRCVPWMDHHCYYCGTCVGFRNMRCFIVWVCYGIALAAILILLTLHKLYQDGLPQSWRWCFWGPWFFFLAWLYAKMNVTFQTCIMNTAAGFHSTVMVKKFRQVLHDGKTLNEAMQVCIAELPMAAPGSEGPEARLSVADTELAQAVERLHTGMKHGKDDIIWGPFLNGRVWPNLQVIFGSKRSWRWVLPLVPGGTGDPFQPVSCSPKACEAWTELGVAMERCRELLKEHKAASSALQFQAEAFLQGHHAFCA